MSNSNNKNWKDFVIMLHHLGVKNSSKEIASVVSEVCTPVTWQQVAGVKAGITRSQKEA